MTHDHDHPHRPDIEDRPLTHHMALTEAVADLLLKKEVISGGELRASLEAIDAAAPAAGARMVARAWCDPGFKARMLENVNKAAAELGIDAGSIPIKAIENSSDIHNVIVCTLCSCYPRLLIGLPPDWYKSRVYRSRAVREPRRLLAEFGLRLEAGVRVDVHDSTADLRYLVIPARPAGTDGWSETDLAAIVTRDCMIGVAVPVPGGQSDP